MRIRARLDLSSLCVLFVAVFALSPLRATAADDRPSSALPQSTSVSQPEPAIEIPPLASYDFQYQDGFYATVTLEKRLKEENKKVQDEENVKLKNLPGFKKEMSVRVLWQKHSAPLAIPMLGLGGRDKDNLSRLWQYDLYKAGCHVMTFDSVFGKEFGKKSEHGVPGNVVEEAKVAARVIEAFLKHEDNASRITSIRLLGTSYGGTISLHMALLAKEGKLALPIDRVLAISPTVALKTAAIKLDQFYDMDYEQGLEGDVFKLIPLRDEKVVKPGEPYPFSDLRMKAGMGYVFRNSLKEVVDKSNKTYELGALERYKDSPNPINKLKDAKHWTFVRYVEEMAFPYWRGKTNVADIQQMWDTGDLRKLLPNCPSSVHLVIAQDDPLNDPAELAELQSIAAPGQLTVLPFGGHLGFSNCKWVETLVNNYFRPLITNGDTVTATP